MKISDLLSCIEDNEHKLRSIKDYYELSILTTDILMNVDPDKVTEELAFVHAFENGIELCTSSKEEWNNYMSLNYTPIKQDVTISCLCLISELVESIKDIFNKELKDTSFKLPQVIIDFLLREDLDKKYTMSSLYLMIRDWIYYTEYDTTRHEELSDIPFYVLESKFASYLSLSKSSYKNLSEKDIKNIYNKDYINYMGKVLDIFLRLLHPKTRLGFSFDNNEDAEYQNRISNFSDTHSIYGNGKFIRYKGFCNLPFITNEIIVLANTKTKFPILHKTVQRNSYDREAKALLNALKS